MALLRIQVDLAIPLDIANKPAVETKLQELRTLIRQAKTYAVKINDGLGNEEMAVRGAYHICHHDEQNVPCQTEIYSQKYYILLHYPNLLFARLLLFATSPADRSLS